MKLRRCCAAGVVALLAACGRGPEPDSSGGSPGSQPALPRSRAAELVPLPENGLRRCRASEPLSAACPRSVPGTRAPYLVTELGGPGQPTRILELAASAHHEGRPRLNRPPRFAHVVVQAGGVRAELGMTEDESLKKASLSDDLLGKRTRYLSLGSFTWGDKRGELVLAPPYPHGGMHGDHLIFVWDGERAESALSLHAWLPLAEASATLRAMVESISS